MSGGDWGKVCPEDWQSNQDALVNGERILSVYEDRTGREFWIITEACRSATTVLLPEDYYTTAGASLRRVISN